MEKTNINTLEALITNGFAGVNARMDTMQAEIDALKQTRKPTGKKTTNSKKSKGVKLVEFTKHDGTVVMVTPKQAEAWTKYREGYGTRVEAQARKEANLAKFEADRNAFKPSKKLLDFIKANPICTRKEAMQHGFVGTKDDLKALKASIRK